VSLVIIGSSAIPSAYDRPELFEYDAVQWFDEHGVSSYISDQRLGETGLRLFDLNGTRGLPYDLREGLSLNSFSFYVLETDWSVTGAQELPFGVVAIDQDTVNEILEGSSVLYVGGPLDNHFIGFLTLS
jgi:hypothetical protein